MSKSTGTISVKVNGDILTFKFGMGAWNILLSENGYKRIGEIFGLDSTIVMPQVFHAGLEYYRRVNKPQDEPYTLAQVCEYIDEMEQEHYNKVEDAFLNSKYLNTTLQEMTDTLKKLSEEDTKKKKKTAG